MKISAVIAEYNPFHLGHALHLKKTREQGCDKIIVLLSGSFTQRGEPAIFDKFTRAACALRSGADLVLELPTFFALSPAQGFAEGAIRILDALGCVETLSFGSEVEDLEALGRVASLLAQEAPEYRAFLQKGLAAGKSFPLAREEAFCLVYGAEAAAPLRSPNAILGLEYLQALARQKSRIAPCIVRREGGSYANPSLSGALSSALAIRRDMREGGTLWQNSVPGQLLPCYQKPIPEAAVFPHLLYLLRSKTPEELAEIHGVTEGLEYKFRQAGQQARNYQELLCLIKSKRYSMARIKRALCCLLLGVTRQKAAELAAAPLYARVLGVREDSRVLLSLLSGCARIPILSSPKGQEGNPMLALDLRASDFYGILQNPPHPAGRDYRQGILRR